MARKSKPVGKADSIPKSAGQMASEPQASYARNAPRRGATKHAKSTSIRRAKKAAPGVIDVDRFFGTMPHLPGNTVKVQRQMRDEW